MGRHLPGAALWGVVSLLLDLLGDSARARFHTETVVLVNHLVLGATGRSRACSRAFSSLVSRTFSSLVHLLRLHLSSFTLHLSLFFSRLDPDPPLWLW